MIFKRHTLNALFFCIFLWQSGNSQIQQVNYITEYNNKEYSKALKTIDLELNTIYSKRVENKEVPSEHTLLKNINKNTDIISLFKNRKEKGFFIENNENLFNLHFYRGLCSLKLSHYRDGLNHLIQSLRFTLIENEKVDRVYYEIALILKNINNPKYFKGYIDALEQAYSLNMKNYKYSHDLGLALINTNHKKKAIFHLTRYIENTDDEISPKLYLKIAGLNESIDNYLEAEKYYEKYAKLNPDNSEILFALGHIAYSRTGNYILAESSLQKALKILEENEIYKISKCYEYMADMAHSNLKFKKAESLYMNTIKYQEKILKQIDDQKKKLTDLNIQINQLKSELIKKKDFYKYEEYELLLENKGNMEAHLDKIKLEFRKLNPGGVRWNLAINLEKQGKLKQAITYYKESVSYEYKTNQSRERIIKLQLKIKRGY